jgi:hypothetical protein
LVHRHITKLCRLPSAARTDPRGLALTPSRNPCA